MASPTYFLFVKKPFMLSFDLSIDKNESSQKLYLKLKNGKETST
jgi:hypothetical protein